MTDSRTLATVEAEIKAAHAKRREVDATILSLRAERDAIKLAESGLLGHVVSYRRTSWRDRTGTEIKFLVEGVGRWGGSELSGRIVRKDGTLGTRETTAARAILTDCGLAEPSLKESSK